MKPESMDAVFQALAHAARRRILDIVRSRPGCNVNDVAGCFEISRIAVMKHLKILATAGLLISEKTGRDRRLYVNTVPIRMIYDRWTSVYSDLWAGALTSLKYELESKPRAKTRRQGKRK